MLTFSIQLLKHREKMQMQMQTQTKTVSGQSPLEFIYSVDRYCTSTFVELFQHVQIERTDQFFIIFALHSAIILIDKVLIQKKRSFVMYFC